MFLLLPFVSVRIKGDALVKAIGFYGEPPARQRGLRGIVGHVLSINESWMLEAFDHSLLSASQMALNINPDDSSRYERDSSSFLYTKFIHLAYKPTHKLAVKIPVLEGRFRIRFAANVHDQEGSETPETIMKGILIDFDNICRILSFQENYEIQKSVDEICKTAFYAFKSPVMTDFFLNFPKTLDLNSFRLTIKSNRYVDEDFRLIRSHKNLYESLQEASVKVISNRRSSVYQLYRAEMFRLALSMISEVFEETAKRAKKDNLLVRIINSWIQLLSYFRYKEEIPLYGGLIHGIENEITFLGEYDNSVLYKRIQKIQKTFLKVLKSLDS
jgi:hypothetical protein